MTRNSVTRPSLWARLWFNRYTAVVVQAAAVLAILAPQPAAAQARGLEDVGGGMIEAVCRFTQSPLVTGIAAFSVVACLVLLLINEGRELLTRVLQIVLAIAGLLALPGIMSMLGMNITC